MSPLPNPDFPRAIHLWIERRRLVVQLHDGREIACPLSFFPRLAQTTEKDLLDWEPVEQGTGIRWPYLNEELSVQELLDGRRISTAKDKLRQAHAPLLRAARKQAGFTQKILAERLRRSQTLISLAERGTVNIGRPYVSEVLEACGLPQDWQPSVES